LQIIETKILYKKWQKEIKNIEEFTKKVALQALEGEIYEVSVVFTEDKHIQQINYKYRGKNRPTNVLSFNYSNQFFKHKVAEIILSFETIKKEATEHKNSFEYQVAWMLIHGILHILGYTHQNDEDSVIMEKKENEVLKKLALL